MSDNGQRQEKNRRDLHYIVNAISCRKTNYNDSLRIKLEIALFFFHYSRITGIKIYEEKAGSLLDEIYSEIQNVLYDNIGELLWMGIWLEYCACHGYTDRNTNEILGDFDHQMHLIVSCVQTEMNIESICGYGRYFAARLKNPANRNGNLFSELLTECIAILVHRLSISYHTYHDLFYVIDFLSEVVGKGICLEKSRDFLNYAVGKLETMVYEDIHFGTYPGTFHPLLASTLLYNAAEKTGIDNYSERALYFIDNCEPGYRQHLPVYQAVNWAFMYDYLQLKTHYNVYEKLSDQWLMKGIHPELPCEKLVESGMRLLAMTDQSFEDCLFWFPFIR